jgi:pilus assembly protein CpaF
MASLIVRDSKNGRVKEVELAKRRFTIGRSDYNDLVLPRDSVSREHCVLLERDDGVYVKDLGSRTGTVMDGGKSSESVLLEDGSRFKAGTFEFQFRAQRQRTTSRTQSGGGSTGLPRDVPGLSAEKNDPLRVALAACHKLLLENKDLKKIDFDNMPEEEARKQTQKVAVQIIKQLETEGGLPEVDRRQLLKQLLDEALGLGPLEQLLADDDISEIMVNNADDVFVEKRGEGMVRANVRFSSDDQVIHVIRRIVAPIGRRINEQTPLVDGRLSDGSRVNAIIPPLAVSGPSLTIRKFPKDRLGVQDLIGFGSMIPQMGDFMEIAVREHRNIVISGGTGSGKTTLLNVVSGFIGKHERIVTVEDVSELKLPQEHVVTLETRPANLEGEGAIHIRDLVKNCLRMRPDRIVVGECRGGEALDMLQAMNTGHDGSLTTIHSNSPRDCIARMETLVLLAGMELPSRAIREQIASAIHLIVQQSRLADGSRKVIAISEVTGMEGGVVTMQDVFLYNQTGFDKNGKVVGYHSATGNVPRFIHQLRKRGIDVDMGIFTPTKPNEETKDRDRGAEKDRDRGRRRRR